jgi:cobalamin biosynthesis Mg chelatase CobN
MLAWNDEPKLANKEQPQKRVQRRRSAPSPQPAAVEQPISEPASQPSAPAQTDVSSEPVGGAPVELALADTSAEQRYGEREAQSRKLENYRGGDVLVIGVSTLVVVLLVVLLIVLLL